MGMSNVGNCHLRGGDGSIFKYSRNHYVEEGPTLFCVVFNDIARINECKFYIETSLPSDQFNAKICK